MAAPPISGTVHACRDASHAPMHAYASTSARSAARAKPVIMSAGSIQSAPTHTGPPRRMLLHAATIFLSAFLLFLVQPVLARQILPWFGGTAVVWTTCMVFFQLVLLLGYAYAHALTRLKPTTQLAIHAALLVVSLAFLPIIPDAGWKPTGSENPVARILALLFATIGLPYFLLSSTSPLVQSWFARALPGQSPYPLFALSNFASMS